MSYCRFSDDPRSDVYVYADVSGGFTTHVARSRTVFPMPLPPAVPFIPERRREWLHRRDTVSDLRARASRVAIGLPHDGASFNHDTPDECADHLEHLAAIGYVVPRHAIEDLRREGEGS